MKERPILFSTPMVRALLNGSKSQTRRILKPQPVPVPDLPGDYWWPCKAFQSMVSISETRRPGARGMAGDACPHGAHSDRIWVRETFLAFGRWETRFSTKKARDEWHFVDMTVECNRAYQYAADNPEVPLAAGRGGAAPGWYKRPAIFMPRAASRILLEIGSVRVERLNDCSEADAQAEGVKRSQRAVSSSKAVPCYWDYLRGQPEYVSARSSYESLWESINGAGAWAANPWVWVIEFKRAAP